MNTLYLYSDLVSGDYEEFESEKPVLEMVMLAMPQGLPEHFELYHNEITGDNLVQLDSEEDLIHANTLTGKFHGLVMPGALASGLVIAALLATTIAVSIIFRPKVPSISSRNNLSESSNNALSNRGNQARPLERIPDIFGTVRAYPDLLSYPLTVFEDSLEYEYSFLCLGRGYYQVDESKIFEGTTPVKSIAYESVEVYAPYTSPNSGIPQLQIGDSITAPLYNVIKNDNVNGEELLSPNAGSKVFRDDNDFIFDFNGETSLGIGFGYWIGNDNVNEQIKFFEDNHPVGSFMALTGFSFSKNQFGTHPAFVMDGTYKITSTTYYANYPADAFGYPTGLKRIQWFTFDQPELVNSCWDLDIGYSLIQDSLIKWMALTSAPGKTMTDWFFLDDKSINMICCNYTAEQGLYKDDGRTQYAFNVGIQTFVQQVDFEGNPFGEIYTYNTTIYGSSESRKRRAATIIQALPFTGRCRVASKRITPSDIEFDGSVVDVIQWRDLYGLSEINQEHFGNITTVYVKTKGVHTALSLEERKLNMIVTRMLPTWNGTSFTAEPNPSFPTGLIPTNNAADVICHVCRDEFIGGRDDSEIDAQQIYDEVESIQNYFGSSDAINFNYTFDSNDITFEETVGAVAQSVFSTAYRMGSQIRLNFERPQTSANLLFNHRNVIPGTMSGKVRFGIENDYDGVELVYTSPEDDSWVTLNIRNGVEGEVPLNPKKLEVLGIRNYRQAYWHAWREWNKLLYGHTVLEFDALPQAELVLEGDKILVADGINAQVQDGDVEGYSALVVKTSQPVVFEDGAEYKVFLQLPDGTVESKTATSTTDPYEILLLSPPSTSLIYEDDSMYKTKYLLVKADGGEAAEFLLTEREPKDSSLSKLTAINYDERYYQNDNNPLTGIAGYGYNYGNYYGGQYYG